MFRGFLGGSHGKYLTDNAGVTGSIPGSGRFLREGNGNPLQYSCLGNPMDRGVTESDMTEAAEHTHKFVPCFQVLNT